ncbi:MAG: FAD-dependent oxidoreductase [Bacteroidota bacterium]
MNQKTAPEARLVYNNENSMTQPSFTELSPTQIETLKAYGKKEVYKEPTILVELGQKNYDFFIVLDGAVHVKNAKDDEHEITSHEANQFTGSTSMLSGRASELVAQTIANTILIRIRPAALKQAIADHSDISDLLMNAFLSRQEGLMKNYVGGVKVIGVENAAATYAIRDFMEKNNLWYHFIDVEKNEAALELLNSFNLSRNDLPVLIDANNNVAVNPSINQLAKYAGVQTDFGNEVFDVLVVGAGPAGLAASVYAASEGLRVITIDSKAPGGQAGKSSKIENYLGFPTGISGSELAQNSYIQAQKFGCVISMPHTVEKVEHNKDYFIVVASDTEPIRAKAIVAATGVDYNRLPLTGIEKFEGAGIYYSATAMHASMCKSTEVGIVGGGNSAGQAALFLAENAKKVYIIIRSKDIRAKMSEYLVRRIEKKDNIEILTECSVTKLIGDTYLQRIELTQRGALVENQISYLFTFIGAKPCIDWIGDMVQKDKKGFICTGISIPNDILENIVAFRTRKPYMFEASLPGFFAVGDVRADSVKRVASAVGEGSVVISDIHKYLTLAPVNS